MNLIRKIYRNSVFFVGDIRREHCPLGFAWGKYEHLIDYDEAALAMRKAGVGYIGLHRNRGDLSNIAISGFMKHAWIHGNTDIIEAVSEGVLIRNPLHAFMSDYAVILRPRISENARKEAWNRAGMMLGCPYDDQFKFDLEDEERIFHGEKEVALANMKKFGLGVSCTELVALAYAGHRRELGLYRTKMGKRQVVLPDQYLSTHFEIVWASRHTTPETAAKLGLYEEGCAMLKEYWNKK